MSFPLLNFQVLNPMGNMINTGLNTYSTLSEGLAKQQEAAQKRKMMPFILEEADLKNKLNQFKVKQEEAAAPYYADLAKGEVDLNRATINQMENQAKISGLNLALHQAKNPFEIRKIQMEMEQLAREMKINKTLEEMGIILPEQKKAYGELQAAGMVNQALNSNRTSSPYQGYENVESAVMETLPASNNPWAYVSKTNQQEYAFNPYEKVAEKYTPSHVIKGKEAAASAEARGLTNSYYKKMEELGSKTEASNASDSNLELMAENWAKIPSYNKGRFGGMIPAWEGAGMSYEAALSRELQTALSAQKGNQSETDLKEFKKSLPGRSMDDYGFYKTYAYLKALNDRSRLQQEFFESQKGRDPSAVQSDWNKFVKANSIFDSPTYKEAYAPYQAIEDKKRLEKLQAERRAAGL